jgi:hypothetical protein
MADRCWKAFEREVASLLGGRRYWANSGEAIDVESDLVVAQCKHVAQCSLEQLSQLVEQVEIQASRKFKAGVVAIKARRGHGRPSPMLMVMTSDTWERLHGRAAEKGTVVNAASA